MRFASSCGDLGVKSVTKKTERALAPVDTDQCALAIRLFGLGAAPLREGRGTFSNTI